MRKGWPLVDFSRKNQKNLSGISSFCSLLCLAYTDLDFNIAKGNPH
jgi:hypothetical protein